MRDDRFDGIAMRDGLTWLEPGQRASSSASISSCRRYDSRCPASFHSRRSTPTIPATRRWTAVMGRVGVVLAVPPREGAPDLVRIEVPRTHDRHRLVHPPLRAGIECFQLILDQDALPVGIVHDRLVGGGSRVHDPAKRPERVAEKILPDRRQERVHRFPPLASSKPGRPVESDQFDGVSIQKGRATNGDRRGLHALGV